MYKRVSSLFLVLTLSLSMAAIALADSGEPTAPEGVEPALSEVAIPPADPELISDEADPQIGSASEAALPELPVAADAAEPEADGAPAAPPATGGADDTQSGTLGDLTWTLTADGVLTIEGVGAIPGGGHGGPSIPWNAHMVTSVILGEGITQIGAWSFSGHTRLRSVTLGTGITQIGEYAFFSDSQLQSIALPAALTQIGSSAFTGCGALAEVTYSGSDWDAVLVESGNSELLLAYQGKITGECGPSLTWTLDRDGVLTISGSGAMDDYTSSMSGGSGDAPWIRYSPMIKKLVIEPGVTALGAGAFRYLSISEAVLPEGLTTIGDSAFEGCALTELTLPASLTVLGQGVFANCRSLTAVWVADGSSSFASTGRFMTSADGRRLILAFADPSTGVLTLPSGLTEIGSYALADRTGITTVIIPEGVTSIGDHAFENCRTLAKAELPSTLASIGSCAFRYCLDLYDFVLPDGLKTIGMRAFDGCMTGNGGPDDSMEIPPVCLVIPNSVTSIGVGAFANCGRLVSAVVGAGVTAMPDHLFSDCRAMTSVTIPAAVAEISTYALMNCAALTDIRLDPDNQSFLLVNGALLSSDGTTLIAAPRDPNFIIPESVQILGDWSFSASPMKYMEIPEGVTAIEYGAMASCRNLAKVDMPESVQSIGRMAFSECGLTEVNVPAGVRSIETNAFSSCHSLASAMLTANVPVLKPYTFSGCGQLTDIYLIGSEADWQRMTADLEPYDAVLRAAVHYTADVTNDGALDPSDAAALLRLPSADVNGDGTTDAYDAAWLLRYLLGLL